MIKDLLILILFFTRIPINYDYDFDSIRYGKSSRYLPIIGLIIGVISYGICYIISFKIKDPIILSSIGVATIIILTGAIHLDGLSDSFDGLFSYRSKEEILRIMKDSRVGVNGVIILIIVILFKVLFLSKLPLYYLIIIPIIGRLNLVWSASFSNYAREIGMGGAIIKNSGKLEATISLLFALFFIYPILNILGLYIVLLTILVTMVMTMNIVKKIGGTTGDTLGMVVELSEMFALFFALMLVVK